MTYIFDFDGVLANTFECYIEFISKNFFLSKAAATKLIMKHTYTNDKPKMYAQIIERFNMTKLEKFLKEQSNILFEDRIKEILQIDGQKVILTRNYAQCAMYVLGQYADLFDPIIGFHEASNKTIGFSLLQDKYNIDLAQSVFITDTVGDILEAKKFMKETQIFATDWGYNSILELEQVLEPSQIISNFSSFIVQVNVSKLRE
ncbi:MAG: HAD family hydrolase [candidate division SR1 bacterium]|nr:HAD family hydrolase [candidate division SR1 bacterium]